MTGIDPNPIPAGEGTAAENFKTRSYCLVSSFHSKYNVENQLVRQLYCRTP